VHSGLAYQAADDLSSGFGAMRTGGTPGLGGPLPLIVFHGDGDHTVAPVNAEKLVAGATGHRTPAHRPGDPDAVQDPGGDGVRPYTRTVYTDNDGVTLVEVWMVNGGGQRLVRRQPRRQLHRPAWTRRVGRDGAVLPRSRRP